MDGATDQINEFLSTPSVWRATLVYAALVMYVQISIHALRVEGDCVHCDKIQKC